MKSIVKEIYNRIELKTLDKFLLFLQSPYHNKSTSQIKLHTILRKDIQYIEKDQIKKSIFNDKELSYSSYKKLMATHLKLLKTFLIIENNGYDELVWLEQLISIQLDEKEILKETKKSLKKSNKNQIINFKLLNIEKKCF